MEVLEDGAGGGGAEDAGHDAPVAAAAGTLASAAGSTSFNFLPQMGRPGLINKDTQLHFGPLDL